MDTTKVEQAVKMFLEAIGEDTSREGLIDTPNRIARMYEELLSGYKESAREHLDKTFKVDGGELVVEKDIAFSSMCEHHLMPFFGKVHIAYIPSGQVVGLSKLARTVEVFAKRLQLQEKMTSEIADAVMEYLAPKGVMVVVEGEHTCMTTRGIKKVGSKTITYCTRGDAITEQKKAEILALIKL
ncbi:MAG TPA: GTP cyclohydrolase I FolE [Clostridia bacterium]|nr:GTP cyclohydrolase I FolE [Clostridia bacterium]